MKNPHKLFFDILTSVEQQSTCARLKVGALIVKNERIISLGWNGVASKQQHCEDFFKGHDFSSKSFDEAHRIFSVENEIHAEVNAIKFCTKNGISTMDTILYVSISPCIHCSKLIVDSGIKAVYYKLPYDREITGMKLLQHSGIEVIQLTNDILNQ